MQKAEKIAKAAYEAMSTTPWDDVPQPIKDGAIAAVQAALSDKSAADDDKGEDAPGEGIVGPRPDDR